MKLFIKLLRIFVCVILRLPLNILEIIAFPLCCIFWLIEDIGTQDKYRKEINNQTLQSFIPFYTTIKTIRQIWRN